MDGQLVFKLEGEVIQGGFDREGGKVSVGSLSSFSNSVFLVTEIFTACISEDTQRPYFELEGIVDQV